jgi:hypothetical protein
MRDFHAIFPRLSPTFQQIIYIHTNKMATHAIEGSSRPDVDSDALPCTYILIT